MRLILLPLVLFSLIACDKSPSEKASPNLPPTRAHKKRSMGFTRTKVHTKEELEALRKQPLVFPDTICGGIVRRIMECEKERISGKYGMQEKMARAKAYSIELKFKKNLNKYLDHCQRTAQGLNHTDVRKCLALSCREMDSCMKSLPGLQKKSGKK